MLQILLKSVIVYLLATGIACQAQSTTVTTSSNPIISSETNAANKYIGETSSEISKPASSSEVEPVKDGTIEHASSVVPSTAAKESISTEASMKTVKPPVNNVTVATTLKPTVTTPVITSPEPLVTTVGPLPSNHNYYNVTNGDVVCIMFVGEFIFSVTYNIGGNKTNQTDIKLPKNSDAGVHVTGSCKERQSQWINVSWGDDFPKTSMRLNFKSINNNTYWTMSTIQAVIPLGNPAFINATDSAKSINAVYNMTEISFTSAYNTSFQCNADFLNRNGNITMEENAYQYPVTVTMKGIKMKAYNEKPKEDSFNEITHCSQDKIADLVPIGVGCALAALIIFVLIAYVVGRRRRSLAYQSV